VFLVFLSRRVSKRDEDDFKAMRREEETRPARKEAEHKEAVRIKKEYRAEVVRLKAKMP